MKEAAEALTGRLKARMVKFWIYHYGDGREAMRVIRFEPKTFRPIHPSGDGWAEGDPPGPLPLLRLAGLNGAKNLFVVEGEGKVDCLREMGLAATCSAHGAQSAKKTDWTPLAGRNVCILPDNDEPGARYAEEVAAILTALDPPAAVKIVNLPVFGDGDDVVDWRKVEDRPDDELAAELLGMADAAPPWAPAAVEPPAPPSQSGIFTLPEALEKFGDQLPPAVIEGLLREGEIVNIISSPKVGKSFLVNGLAMAVATGRPWLCDSWRCAVGSVVIIDGELPPSVLTSRLRAISTGLGVPLEAMSRVLVWPRWGTPPAAGETSPLAELKPGLAYIRTLAPKLIIIDPFYFFLPPGASENDNAEIGSFYRDLNALAANIPGAAIALVHHTSKGLQGEKALTDVGAGAGAFSRGAATHLVLREHEQEGCYVVEARCRTWKTPSPVTIRFDFPLWMPTEHDPEQVRGRPKTCARAPEVLSDGTFAELLDGTPKSKAALVRALQTRHRYPRDDASMLIGSVIERHNLDDLPKDTEKNCGQFMASSKGSGGGFRFWRA